MSIRQSILERTLGHLRSVVREPVPVREVHLTRYFTIVEVSGGRVGTCMSSFNLTDARLSIIEDGLMEQFGGNALDVVDRELVYQLVRPRTPEASQANLVASAFLAAIASALSVDIIREGGDTRFHVSDRPPAFPSDVETALVIGFGGYFDELAAMPSTRHIHVADLAYHRRRSAMDEQMESYRRRFPGKRLTISGAARDAEMQGYELVCISGSTLGNGTLDRVLSGIDRRATVVLQGQSASIHPVALFDAGVTWIATTVKPPALTLLARGDYSGKRCRELLEGGLPWLYLLPRGRHPA